MDSALYARITDQLGESIGGLYDIDLDDNYDLTIPVIVAQEVSDTPAHAITGDLATLDQRISFDIRALTAPEARAVKSLLIAALRQWKGGSIKACQFESGGPMLRDTGGVGTFYHLSVDFILTF